MHSTCVNCLLDILYNVAVMENCLYKVKNRYEFRKWLKENGKTEKECWIKLKRGKPEDPDTFYYLDAVEEALCFGWIDSTWKTVGNKKLQRFTPRKNGPWSELNKERVRRLEKLGLMEDEGRKVLPPMGPRSFKFDEDIIKALKERRCYTTFKNFPPLYQRIRAYNVSFYKTKDKAIYDKALKHLIEETEKGKMFGEWNDYGRLLKF